MDVKVTKNRGNDFVDTASRMLSENVNKMQSGDFFIVRDETPEYRKYGDDSIFATFEHAGQIFHVAFD